MPLTVEMVVAQLFDDMSFDVLIDWADILGVEHCELLWLDDEWPDKESELKLQCTEALIRKTS